MQQSTGRFTTRHRSTLLIGMVLALPVAAQDLIGTCAKLPEHLEACAPYECTFDHPLTHTRETRTVAIQENGLCRYRESMPSEGAMTCHYDVRTAREVADYYRAYFDALLADEAPPADDVLDSVLADGTCAVTGYG